MDTIDFSCKHDVLVRHKDGSMLPMDEPYYETEKIADDTWKIMSRGSWHYLVKGDEEAIAIDTGMGAGNLRKYLEELAGVKVQCCINTHHHFDHTANNAYFNLVYMSAESVANATVPYPSFAGIEFPQNYRVQIVGDGDIIPLRGRKLEIIEIGNHTPGGIAILDRRQKLLFVGDEFMPVQVIETSVTRFRDNMSKLLNFRNEFRHICSGAGNGLMEATKVEDFYEAACMIINGQEGEPLHEDYDLERTDVEYIDGKQVVDCQYLLPEDRINGSRSMRRKQLSCFCWKDTVFLYDNDNI